MPRHYVNNKDFYNALVEYRVKVSTNSNAKIPDYIGECVLKICNRLSTKPNFRSYTYRDELIADGIENCIVAINGFNPEKSNNPFAYFTRIAWNAFIRRIKREKKEQYVKYKNARNLMDMDYNTEVVQLKSTEASDEIIESFESKLANQKKLVNKKPFGLEVFTND
jgi:DNA-directed RNA polymerase specialized sigma24 family protein